MIISKKLQDKLVKNGWNNKIELDFIYDICIKYPKQFFGEDEDEYGFYYEQYTQEIFYLLQQGKTQKEIEDYIIKNSILLK